MNKKFIIAVLAVGLVFLGFGCTSKDNSLSRLDSPSSLAGSVGETGADKISATEVVEDYLLLTLGTLPDANVDYDAAKELLTPDKASEFVNPTFIPMSYCIQDGPDEVSVGPAEFVENYNWFVVSVKARWGMDEWEKMWEFQVVPVEGGEYMINDIMCVYE